MSTVTNIDDVQVRFTKGDSKSDISQENSGSHLEVPRGSDTSNLEISRENDSKFTQEDSTTSNSQASNNTTDARKRFIKENIFMRKYEEDKLDSSAKHQPREDAKLPADCYGTIEFKETTKRSTAQFIRFSDPDNKPANLFELMIKHWGLETPRLLISVTGGAKSFDISPRLKKDFQEGLQKVASTPGAWVISGGTNTGVMKMVGDANRGTKNVCIGVVTWGVLANRDMLTTGANKVSDGTFPYDLGSYLVLPKGLSYLDHNHTHFLLVDDGTVEKWGVEINFRGKFEKYVMKPGEGEKRKIPTVLLVVEGGPGTLDTVHNAVKSKIPCVLVKGSGRVADLLVHALSLKDKIPQETKHKGLLDEIKKLTTKKTEKYYKIVLECLEQKQIFTIVDQETGLDTDDAILTALLKNAGTTLSDYEKLHLTLLWGRVDLAVKVLSPMNQWNEVNGDEKDEKESDEKDKLMVDGSNGEKELHRLMIMALAMNNIGFVKLLLDYGISMRLLLTRQVLEFLYAYRCWPMSPSTIIWKNKQRQCMELADDDKKFFDGLLVYSAVKKQTSLEKIDLEDVKNMLFRLLRKVPEEYLANIIEIPEAPTATFVDPYRQLFIWAVINNMLGMALFLWEFVEDGIATALIASAITKRLKRGSRLRNMQDEDEESLESSLDTYKRLSIDLMDACYKTKDKETELLVTMKLDLFSNSYSSLDFAVATNQKDFVAHRAIQDILNDVWNGSIKSSHISQRKLFATIFCPLMLLNMDIRPTEKTKNMIQSDECDKNPAPVKSEKGNETDIQELSIWSKWYYFHIDSPVVKFHEHTFGYLLFLMLFAYVAILEKKSTTPSECEYLLIVTVAGYAVNEVYQMTHIHASSVGLMLRKYFFSFWNQLDLLCIVLFIIALALRHFEYTLEAGHLIYAIDVSFWICRIINILNVDPISGPYVFMIGKMFKDMMHFLVLLLIFLMSYGITVTAILEPSPDVKQMFVFSIFKPYFHIYGEYFINDPANDTTITWFGTPTINSYAEPIAFIWLGIYLFLANILLLNLLIAIFNSRYEKVMANASRTWKFQRYKLIFEYAQQRTFWCPPVSLIQHLWLLIQHGLHLDCIKKPESGLYPNRKVKKEKKDALQELESKCLITVIHKRKQNEKFEIAAAEGSPPMPKNELEKKFDKQQQNNENMESRITNMESRMTKLLEEMKNMLANEHQLKTQRQT